MLLQVVCEVREQFAGADSLLSCDPRIAHRSSGHRACRQHLLPLSRLVSSALTPVFISRLSSSPRKNADREERPESGQQIQANPLRIRCQAKCVQRGELPAGAQEEGSLFRELGHQHHHLQTPRPVPVRVLCLSVGAKLGRSQL